MKIVFDTETTGLDHTTDEILFCHKAIEQARSMEAAPEKPDSSMSAADDMEM